MQSITILAVGSLKMPWAAAGASEYVSRLEKDAKFTVEEVPASKQKDPVKQAEEECQSLLKRLEKADGEVWVLDERGKAVSSPQLAADLEALSDEGRSLTVVLGGAYGLTEEVRNRANRVVKLSDMVLPHELCRVVLLEQMYRAIQIRKGTGYHHV